MRAGVKTTGELRSLLLETIEGVRSGTLDIAKAGTIAKLAGAITASLTAEAQMALVERRLSIEAGSAPLTRAIEATALPSRENPARSLDFGPSGKKWCEQCEMNVSTGTAKSCNSPFCKVQAA